MVLHLICRCHHHRLQHLISSSKMLKVSTKWMFNACAIATNSACADVEDMIGRLCAVMQVLMRDGQLDT